MKSFLLAALRRAQRGRLATQARIRARCPPQHATVGVAVVLRVRTAQSTMLRRVLPGERVTLDITPRARQPRQLTACASTFKSSFIFRLLLCCKQ